MKPIIIFVVTHPMSVTAFLLPHIRSLQINFNVLVITNSDRFSSHFPIPGDIKVISLPLSRSISVLTDLRVLLNLFSIFRNYSPLAVHTITPKSGLLGILSAFFAGVPFRVHSFTGQVWVTRTGISRMILKFFDFTIGVFSTHQLVDSPSQLQFLLKNRILKPDNARCLGAGSICGVNTIRFSPNEFTKLAIRSELRTSYSSFVCLFLGRLTPDKGIFDLAAAFSRVAPLHPETELWFVGPDEGDHFKAITKQLGSLMHQVKRVDFTSYPEKYMQAADLFCLPSYREGFGSSVIEAASCGVPSLVSRIYGLTDAVLEEKTGWMFSPGDTDDLSFQLNRLISDPALVSSTGHTSRQFVIDNFDQQLISDKMVDFYMELFDETHF